MPGACFHPLLPVLLAYCAGSAAAQFFGRSAVDTTSCLIAGVLLLAGAATAFFKKYYTAAALLLFCVVFIAGFCRLHQVNNPAPARNTVVNYIDAGPVTLEAVITGPPEETLSRTRLTLSVQAIHTRQTTTRVTGTMLLSMQQARDRLSYGDRILFTARLHRPRNFQNPGGFDYVQHLARKNICVTAFLETDQAISKISANEANAVILAVEHMRSRIRAAITENLNPPASDILRALIIGEKGTIPDPVRSRFSNLGLAHLLSISGLHVGIFALVSFWLIFSAIKLYPRLLLYIPAKKIAVFLSILPVAGYCMIAGMGTPAVRSGLMVLCYLVTLLLDRPQNLLHTLFVAAFVLLAVAPQSLFELSFQLSFTAVFSIIVLTPAWKKALPENEPDPLDPPSPLRVKIRRYLSDSLLGSAAAILGTAPLVAWYFYIFAPAGFITNLIMVPLAGFIIVPLGLAAALLLFIYQPLGIALFKISGTCTDLFLAIAGLLHRLLGDGITVTKPLLWEIVFFYVLLFSSVLCRTKKQWATLAACCLVFICALAAQTVYRNSPTNLLSVTFLDVGAGDAAVIELPNREILLIDGGGLRDDSFDMGKAVIAPYLYTRGLKNVDYIVMTHPHRDHAGGLPYIAKKFHMREFWHNGSRLYLEPYHQLLAIAANTGSRVLACTSAMPRRMIGGVSFNFIHPSTTGTHDLQNANNDSLVLKLTYNDISFLFTADIEQETEAELAAAGVDLSATILKIPHHGSKTSSTQHLLKAVAPQIAVISGRSYGNRQTPHPSVKKRLEDFSINYLTTERCGAITIVTDGKTFRVATYTKPQDLQPDFTMPKHP